MIPLGCAGLTVRSLVRNFRLGPGLTSCSTDCTKRQARSAGEHPFSMDAEWLFGRVQLSGRRLVYDVAIVSR
jgi:hypothetical protein